jgi:hypothetical protein
MIDDGRLQEMDRRRETIEEAIAGGFLSFSTLRALVGQGLIQIWFGERSVMLSEVQSYDEHKAIQCFAAAGCRTEIEDVIRPAIEEWGRSQGCDLALVEASRAGWEKALRPHGYRRWSVTLAKALCDVE